MGAAEVMRNVILEGDVFDTLPRIPKGSVDVCVTSPPYWMLRSYLPKDHPMKHLELGQEPTPQEFVSNMVRVFGLVRETMADHATCWINCGDTYAGGAGGRGDIGNVIAGVQTRTRPVGEGRLPQGNIDIDAGNLCLIPQRLAIALQDDGWWVRSVVIWHKPSAMPCSVKGWRWERCRKKVKARERGANHAGTRAGYNPSPPHPDNGIVGANAEWEPCPGCKNCEKTDGLVLRRGSWRPTSSYEPVLMLAKSDRYFADGEGVKTPPAESTVGRDKYTRVIDDPDEQYAVAHDHETFCDGANLRDVWTVASQPLKEAHYAAFPVALVEKCLRAGTSQEGYCPHCAKPWVRVLESSREYDHVTTSAGKNGTGPYAGQIGNGEGTHDIRHGVFSKTQTLGWRPSCSCPAHEARPGLVLDPFSGSGRTGICARRLGLDYIGCELNEQFVAMGKRLIREDAPLFNGDFGE